jgi:hypothetical protein
LSPTIHPRRRARIQLHPNPKMTPKARPLPVERITIERWTA